MKFKSHMLNKITLVTCILLSYVMQPPAQNLLPLDDIDFMEKINSKYDSVAWYFEQHEVDNWVELARPFYPWRELRFNTEDSIRLNFNTAVFQAEMSLNKRGDCIHFPQSWMTYYNSLFENNSGAYSRYLEFDFSRALIDNEDYFVEISFSVGHYYDWIMDDRYNRYMNFRISDSKLIEETMYTDQDDFEINFFDFNDYYETKFNLFDTCSYDINKYRKYSTGSCFVANGGERHLQIGNFKPRTEAPRALTFPSAIHVYSLDSIPIVDDSRVYCPGDSVWLNPHGLDLLVCTYKGDEMPDVVQLPEGEYILDYHVPGCSSFSQKVLHIVDSCSLCDERVIPSLDSTICPGETITLPELYDDIHSFYLEENIDSFSSWDVGLYEIDLVKENCGKVATWKIDVRDCLSCYEQEDLELCVGRDYNIVDLLGRNLLYYSSNLNFEILNSSRVGRAEVIVYSTACEQIDTFDVTFRNCSDCSIYIPNAFSPNNDGINDAWCIYQACGKIEYISLYDRWGNQVYFNNNFSDSFCLNREDLGEYITFDQLVYVIGYEDAIDQNAELKFNSGILYIIK